MGGAQSRPVAAVALGYDLAPTPNRPLTLDCLGHVATRCPQLGPLDGLGHVQVGDQRFPPWVSSMAKNAMRGGLVTPVGEAFAMPDPRWTSRALKKEAVPLLNGTALSTQRSGNPELLEGTKRKCDPCSAS